MPTLVISRAVSGLMGGLFSASGPPLVSHLYRQPFPAKQVRETLVSVFALNPGLRLAIVAGAKAMAASTVWTALVAVPVVIGATAAARRWPPAVSPATQQRIVFGLLLLSGISLAAPSLWRIVGS